MGFATSVHIFHKKMKCLSQRVEINMWHSHSSFKILSGKKFQADLKKKKTQKTLFDVQYYNLPESIFNWNKSATATTLI